MISFRLRSFCKINLALAVLGRRSDGYHEIRTVFQTVDLHDELEFRAATSLQVDCEQLPAEIRLHKRVPPGSGLGGGSSNAAAALIGLTRLWNLDLSREALVPLARGLGADVPFFLEGGTAMGSGRGDEVRPLRDLPEQNLVVVYPGVHVATASAYRALSLELTSGSSLPKIQRFCSQVEDGVSCLAEIFNDFETTILRDYPAVREAKESLTAQGAAATLLSGSGSSVFGFFRNEESALAASRELDRGSWRAFPAKTLSRAEYFHRMHGC
jgi:4-diphosphocytidyl-2-C-methyl-D-erythritol kinase